MDQASASPAASCACNPAAPRTSSSCSRSAGRSRTAAPPPARSDPQCEPHAAPSNSRPRSSSPALCRLKAKRLPAAGFLLRRDREPGRFSEGLLLRRLQLETTPHLAFGKASIDFLLSKDPNAETLVEILLGHGLRDPAKVSNFLLVDDPARLKGLFDFVEPLKPLSLKVPQRHLSTPMLFSSQLGHHLTH